MRLLIMTIISTLARQKDLMKQNGEWVEAPPLPDDYFENPVSANAFSRPR